MTYQELPTFDISPQTVTNIVILEELRILNSKLDRIYNYFDRAYCKNYKRNEWGTWIKRKKRKLKKE